MTKFQKAVGMRQALRRWRVSFPAMVTDDYEGLLLNAVIKPLPCGCTVTGNGTIPLPLTVKQCAKHRKLK